MDAIGDSHKPAVTVTYFVPDECKSGGRYETVTEQIKRVDTVMQKIILMCTEGHAGMDVVIEIDVAGITDGLYYASRSAVCFLFIKSIN